MKPSLSLILPINRKVNPFEDVFSEGSLAELGNLSEVAEIAFLITAQGKFDTDAQMDARRLLNNAGFECYIAELPEEDPCRMLNLRQTGALLKPESTYYMFMNDYLEFRPGSSAKYAAAIKYLEDHPKCGSVGNYGFFGSVSYGDEIRPDAIGRIAATAKGLMLRNIGEGKIFPDEMVNMTGPMCEMAAVIWLNLNGYYYAKQFKVPTKSKRGTKRVRHELYPGDNQLHSAALAEVNVRAWIRKVTNKPYYLYGDPVLNLGFGFKPKGRR